MDSKLYEILRDKYFELAVVKRGSRMCVASCETVTRVHAAPLFHIVCAGLDRRSSYRGGL